MLKNPISQIVASIRKSLHIFHHNFAWRTAFCFFGGVPKGLV